MYRGFCAIKKSCLAFDRMALLPVRWASQRIQPTVVVTKGRLWVLSRGKIRVLWRIWFWLHLLALCVGVIIVMQYSYHSVFVSLISF